MTGVARMAGTAALLREILGLPTARAQHGARSLLDGQRSLAELARLSATAIHRETGVTPAQAQRLAAAFELGRRVEDSGLPPRLVVRTPEAAARAVAARLRGREREQFLALLLDGKHRLRRVERVSEGTLTSSLVHPREVFRAAIAEGAAAVVVVHNHPSGDPEPSAEDLEVTRRLVEVGRLVGIPVLDHVVVGDGRWVSLRERMGF